MIKYNNLNIFKDCLDFSQVENKFISILYIILLFLFGITLQLFTFLALFYFSPTLLMVTEVISPTLYWIAVTIKKGDCIAQAVLTKISKIRFIETDKLSDTQRGEGGFGSTDRKEKED